MYTKIAIGAATTIASIETKVLRSNDKSIFLLVFQIRIFAH